MAFTHLAQLIKQTVVESDDTQRFDSSVDFTEEFDSILSQAQQLKAQLSSPKLNEWLVATDDLYGIDTIDDLHAAQFAIEGLISSLENINRAIADAE